MEKGKKVVKRGRPFNTNSITKDGSKRARVGDGADDSWEDFIPIAAARQYRKEMEEEEVEMGEDDAGDGVRPKNRIDILYFWRTAKEYVDAIAKLNPRQVEAVHEIGFGGILDYKIPEIPREMALWILSVFKREQCKIQFSEEEFVRVTEDDVHLT